MGIGKIQYRKTYNFTHGTYSRPLCKSDDNRYEFNPGPETSLFFSSTYVELYRTSTCCGREFFLVSRLGIVSHHGGRRLWPLPSPVARRHPNQAHRRPPHTMGDAVCAWFGLNPPGGRVVSTPPPTQLCLFFMHARC